MPRPSAEEFFDYLLLENKKELKQKNKKKNESGGEKNFELEAWKKKNP